MAEHIPSILIAGIDEPLFEVVCQSWSQYYVELSRVDDVVGAFKRLTDNKFHLICIVLPDDDEGRKFTVAQIRLMRSMTLAPIIMLTHTPFDQALMLRALHDGADDFGVCPGTLEEATAVGMALIRRFTQYNTGKKERPFTMLVTESILISIAFHKVFVRGKEVELMKKEFDILKMLLQNQGRVFTYAQIFRKVWGEDYEDSAKSILWQQISSLRKKLQTEPNMPVFIETVQGIGYRFNP